MYQGLELTIAARIKIPRTDPTTFTQKLGLTDFYASPSWVKFRWNEYLSFWNISSLVLTIYFI